MRLSAPQHLLPHSWTDADVEDIARISQSVSLSSSIAELRYGAVPEEEVRAYFRAGVEAELEEWSWKGTIRQADSGRDQEGSLRGNVREAQNNGNGTDRYEALVVRDLDWQRRHDQRQSPPDDETDTEGTIVAFCALRYNAARDPTARGQPSTSHDGGPSHPPFPPSGNAPLHAHFNTIVERALDLTFRTHPGLPTYEVLELCTLSPGYLRKGIAKGLVEWVFGYADREGVPVVLAGSPMGVGLYRKVGFVEIGGREEEVGKEGEEERWPGEQEGTIRVDLSEWGGEGVHRHTLMVRWPAGWQGTTEWWEYVTHEKK